MVEFSVVKANKSPLTSVRLSYCCFVVLFVEKVHFVVVEVLHLKYYFVIIVAMEENYYSMDMSELMDDIDEERESVEFVSDSSSESGIL